VASAVEDEPDGDRLRDAAPGPGLDERQPEGQLLADISRAVVRVYRTHTGRGPTRCRTLYRANVVVVILNEVMTTAERNLAHSNLHDAVGSGRHHLHEVMRDDLIASCEEATGCNVETLVGSLDAHADLAVEVFILDGFPGIDRGIPAAG
jgi:uncharacterized protein YbcI